LRGLNSIIGIQAHAKSPKIVVILVLVAMEPPLSTSGGYAGKHYLFSSMTYQNHTFYTKKIGALGTTWHSPAFRGTVVIVFVGSLIRRQV